MKITTSATISMLCPNWRNSITTNGNISVPTKRSKTGVIKLREVAESSDVPFIVVAIEDEQIMGSAALVNEDMRTRTDLSPFRLLLWQV